MASADAVYTYTGAPFDTELGDAGYLAHPLFPLGESLDLKVDFAAPLAPGLVDQSVTPVSWSYELGGGGFKPGGGSVVLLSSIFSTNSSGNIDNWFFSAFSNPTGFGTSGTAGDRAFVFSAHGGAGSASTATIGTWTASTTVPEPTNASLLISGLMFLLFLARRWSHV